MTFGWGVQTENKKTMIDISCKFYLQKNEVTYTYSINLDEAIIRH